MNGSFIMANKKKKKITKALLTDEDMRPSNIKINMTMRVTQDLLDKYRTEAERLGIGYQTLMQMKLKEGIESPSIIQRIETLEKKIL